jgi:hypothetical protein
MKNFSQLKILHIAILLIAVAGIYFNALNGDFLYDDKPMIAAYDFIKDINNLPKAFMAPTSLYGNTNYYRPLQTISNMTDYFLWGKVTTGFHATNILFHVLAVLLLYWGLQLLFKKKMIAFFTALTFAVHPVNTSVVSYIAGRADAMLLCFMLLSFGFYIKAVYLSGGPVNFHLSILFFSLGLLAKESAVIIPVLFLLFDYYLVRYTDLEEKRTNTFRYMPYGIILAAYFIFRFTKMSFFVDGSITPFPLGNRIITVPYCLAQYFRLVVFPNDLHIGRMPWVAGSIADSKIIISVIAVCSVTAAVFILRKRNKTAWFGLIWFYLMIFPTLNIITPLFYTFAENWLYIPGIGLYIVVVSWFLYCSEKSSTVLKYFIFLLLLFLITCLGVLTIRQNNFWQNEISMGKNTLKYNPREFKIWNNLGVVYLGKGDLDSAEKFFKKCLEIKPDTGMAYFNLYRVYMARKNRPQALKYLDKARKYDPKRIEILTQKMGIKD